MTRRWREMDSNHRSPVRATLLDRSRLHLGEIGKNRLGLHRRSREAKTPAENDRGSCASLAAQCLTRPRLTRPRLANDKAAIILGLFAIKGGADLKPRPRNSRSAGDTDFAREGTGSSNPLRSSGASIANLPTARCSAPLFPPAVPRHRDRVRRRQSQTACWMISGEKRWRR